MMRTILTAALGLQAGMVAAQGRCPEPADLARGIVVQYEDGSSETFRDIGQGLVGVDGVDVDGYAYRMELAHGLHLVSYNNVIDGVADETSRISYDYGVPQAELPVPSPGGRWNTPVTVTDQFGVRSEPQSHTWGSPAMVDIGGCSYEIIEVQIAYKTGDGYVESVEYIPALNFGYLVWSETATTARTTVRPVAISVAAKK